MFILNVFIEACHYCVILKSTVDDDTRDNTRIFLRLAGVLNPILPVSNGTLLKITCGAVSINKDVFNITKQIHFYQREYLVEVSSAGLNRRLTNIQAKIDELYGMLNRRAPAPPPLPLGLITVNP